MESQNIVNGESLVEEVRNELVEIVRWPSMITLNVSKSYTSN